MQKYQIQNMLSGGDKNIPSDAKYRLIVSLNVPRNKKRWNDDDDYHLVHDFNEMLKYQRIFMFECFLCQMLNEYINYKVRRWPVIHLNDKFRSMVNVVTNNTEYIIYSKERFATQKRFPIRSFDDIYVADGSLIHDSATKISIEELRENFVIGDTLKYLENDIDSVCKQLQHSIKIFNSKNENAIERDVFYGLVMKVCPEQLDDMVSLFDTMMTWDEDKFVNHCKDFIKRDYYDDAMSQENVKIVGMKDINYDPRNENKWILPRGFNAVNMYEALTHTVNNVYIMPSKKNYDIKQSDDGDYRIIDKITLYFESDNDLKNFMDVYSSTGKLNESAFYAGYRQDISDSSLVNVKQFNVDDLKRISEKLGSITTNAILSPRKTTFDENVYGHIYLPTFVQLHEEYIEDNAEYYFHLETSIEKTKKDLEKLHIHNAVVNIGTYVGYMPRSNVDHMINDSNVRKYYHRSKLFDNFYALKNHASYHLSEFLSRKHNYTTIKNYNTSYFSQSTYVIAQVKIPITLENSGDIDKYLRYVHKSKLLGDKNICLMELAPYAGNNDEISDSIVDAIMKL